MVNRNKINSLGDAVGHLIRVCIVYPWITILLFALVGLGSAIYAARNFSINTDISNLIAPDIDWRQREIALDKAFPSRGCRPFWRWSMRRRRNLRRSEPMR